MSEKLLEKRVSAYIQSSPIRTTPNVKGDIWATWPMSKLVMYQDGLCLEILFAGKFEFPYKNIIKFKKILLGFQIEHNIQGIKPYVFIGGMGNGGILIKKVKEVISNNNLGIEFDDK